MKSYVPFAAALEAATADTAEIARLIREYEDMAALLREYERTSRDVKAPSKTSLIGRTRALLARIEAAP